MLKIKEDIMEPKEKYEQLLEEQSQKLKEN